MKWYYYIIYYLCFTNEMIRNFSYNIYYTILVYIHCLKNKNTEMYLRYVYLLFFANPFLWEIKYNLKKRQFSERTKPPSKNIVPYVRSLCCVQKGTSSGVKHKIDTTGIYWYGILEYNSTEDSPTPYRSKHCLVPYSTVVK